MPVIKGQKKVKALDEARRNSLLTTLSTELAGKTSADGPVIYEIPLDQSDRMDVLVVWQEFKDLRSEDRTDLVMDAYGGQKEKIAMALGVTPKEALEQGLFPYSVEHIEGITDTDVSEMRKAMFEEGGWIIGDGLRLAFPTRAMAEEAMRRLYKRLPNAAWTIREMASYG